MIKDKNCPFVRDIEGDFFVPSYQRGYRWGKDEVERLLDDIYSNDRKSYCLQPIVVKLQPDGKYELIDGQQRLTTVYLIYKYLHSVLPNIREAQFTIDYQTRESSREYLLTLDENRKEEYIDFWHMWQAYAVIKQWFAQRDFMVITKINEFLSDYVKIIWYEVDQTENSEKLFARLNIGKIPLTSAELVKAMFLSKANAKMSDAKQDEIALQWDNIERELHEGEFWNFLANGSGYATRIDLVLDLMAEKTDGSKYHTFNWFDDRRKEIEEKNKEKKEKEKSSITELWDEINRTFYILKDWYGNSELYHKVGYLVASERKTLKEIYELAKDKKKSQFKSELDGLIRESIKIKDNRNYGELSYEKSKDYKMISRLLLLFNVVSVYKLGDRFSFYKYKCSEGGAWSLEHIHAQNSEGLKTVKEWHEWLSLHLPYVKKLAFDEKLIETMQKQISDDNLRGDDFEKTQTEVFDKLSKKPDETKHTVSNLALLRTGANAALNNSTFAVKRGKIIEMDKNGEFIPHCTKMVFLKYYNDTDDNSLYYWSDGDRENYVKNINETLKDYLEDDINWDLEVDGE